VGFVRLCPLSPTLAVSDPVQTLLHSSFFPLFFASLPASLACFMYVSSSASRARFSLASPLSSFLLLVASYADLKRCLESSYADLQGQAAAAAVRSRAAAVGAGIWAPTASADSVQHQLTVRCAALCAHASKLAGVVVPDWGAKLSWMVWAASRRAEPRWPGARNKPCIVVGPCLAGVCDANTPKNAAMQACSWIVS